MPGEPTIAVVEDEPTQRHILVDYLTRQGFKAIGVTDGAALRRTLQREEFALVLLDVGLPGEDGISLARYLREHHPRVGIIMVTAAGDTVDRVIGLETGPTTISPSRSNPANCWRASEACCAVPVRAPRPRAVPACRWVAALARDWLLEATSHREADSFDRAIDLRVTRLRRKIEHDPAHPETIRTVRGVGYMFVPG